MHVELIVPYSKSIRQQNPGDTVIRNIFSLTCMKMVDLATGCFEIVEIPRFDLEEVTIGNDEYMYKSSASASQLFNNTWLCRYPRPRKAVYENGSEFKRDFTAFLNNFVIKPDLTLVKKPQANAPVEQVHQVIFNMLVTQDLDNKVFNYINPWGETLVSISWVIIDSYSCTIIATPGQSVFGMDMLFNVASVIDWQVVTTVKQRQVDIYNVRENAKRVTYD